MRDLRCQVTSSLLRFPNVTIEALGEDEITLDSVLHGRFTVGAGVNGLAWLACGPQLEVVQAVTGERLSAYCFSGGGGGEHPPSVLAARPFTWLKRSGLLVGLEEGEGSMLCLYDLAVSRVVKAVVIPGRITAIEPLVSYGGASASTQHLHQSLRWFFGVAAVVTDLGHVLLVDLCLDDLECSQSELEASDLEVVSKSPGEIPRLREMESRQGRHLCLQLSSPTGTGASALQYVPRTNQLAVGFSDGNLQLWNMKTLKKEYHSQLDGGRVPVYAFTFQEPENDPRNCCYLWAVQSAQDHEGDVVSLHLLQLAFSERKCLASGKILYEGLEYCEERYSQDLSSSSFPHRAQTSNTRLLSCQTIEKFRHHPDREDSVNEVASPDTSVAVFCWQVKAYGQANPSTYVGVFDINRWYHAQMPDSLRVGESLRSCPYLAVWSLDPVVEMTSPCPLLDVLVHDRSLSRGMSYACPAPEQFFSPTTYNFDATCLLNSGIVHLTCSGHQKETLSFLKKAAPFSGDVISSCYSRCLMSGLLSARLTDVQPSSLSQEEQLDAILSTAVETSSLGLITSCIKHWTAEDQPGSALNLRHILEWAWDKVVHTKEELDGICAPLFDSSSNFTDPQTLQLLQHSQRLLGNLSTIFHCLLNEARELTERGVVGLMNKNLVSSLISQYAQVVLWFCRTGLLPEGSDEDAVQISRPFYSHSVIKNDYASRREELHRRSKGKWCADCLMIDGLVAQCGERLVNLWKRDEGGTGQYPPPTLHALLDTYLLEDIDESAKHAIVIYLLLDVMYSFPNKSGASVESFPTAFAVPIGLVKLVQGLWLLDHHDHQSSLELLLHPATPSSQWAWQHQRVLQALMIQGQHAVALRYLHATRPPVTTTAQATLCLSVLLHNRCLVEAWALLRQHSNRLNVDELRGFLFQSCQELGLVADLLKLPLGLAEQECLVKFLQGTGGLLNRELLMVHYLQQANYIPALQLNHTLNVNLVNERDPKLKERSRSRNSILDLYGKVLPRVQRKLAMERAKPYQHPATIHREVSRPQPLSTIVKRSANGKVLTRAAFISNVLTKIEEVWVGRDSTPQCSPLKSPTPKATEAFVGTPVTMTTKRKSRLLDLVVYPSSQSDVPQNPLAYFSPPRRSVNWAAPRSINRASELNLLQTPQVVKRARALAASGPVFSSFTPQSILRSSLRPTPVATPSASPARSLTPPLRPKESRITFVEEDESPEPEKGPARWSNGIVADSEMSLLARGSPLPKSALESWATHTPEEEEEEEDGEGPEFRLKFPVEKSPHRRGSESGSSAHEVAAATGPPALLPAFPRCLGSVGPDTSRASLQSADTSLEFHDAPLPDDPPGEEPGRPAGRRDEEVGIDPKALEEQEVPPSLEEEARPTNEQSPLPPLEDEECQQREAELDELTRPKLEKEEEEEEEGKEEGDPLAAPEVNDEEVAERASVEEEQVAAHHEEDQAPEEEQEEEEATVVMEVCVESGPSEAAAEDVRTTMEQDQTLDLGLDEDEDDEEPSYTDQPTEEAAAQEQPEPAEQAEPMDPAEDLTEFVEKHLFGNDLSPPLTRSGIHEASNTWTSCNSEPVCDIKEEESSPLPPSVQTSRRADASVASSDPTGTDSHSVVSLGDTEDLSSAVSDEREEEEEEEEDEIDEEECDQDEEEEEEEEDDDDDEEEEEEEDSGSEVEIIEEVQGNGGLSRLQADAHHFQDQLQPHPHHTPVQSELSSAVLSLMVEGDMEGEVVMMALETGAVEEDAEEEEEGEEEEGGGVCYSQLKPSTTLLVPLELVGESEQDPVRQPLTELSDAGHGAEPDASPPDAPGGFSLRLETEDADCEADAVPLEGVVPELPNHLPATPPADAADTSVEALEPDTLDGIELDVSVVPIMPDLVPFTAEETNNLAEMDPAEIAPAEMDPADIAPAEIDPADIAPADIDPAEMDMASVEPAEDGEPQREDGGMRPDVIPELSPAPREEEEESTCSDRVEVAMETEEQNHREEDEDKIEEEEKEEVGVKRGEDEMLDEEEDEKLEEEEEREEDEKLEEEEERGEDEKLEEEEERGEDEKLEKEEEERGEEEEEERDEEEQTKTSAPAETLMEETIRPGATETGQKVTPSVPAEENETCETAGQEAVTLDAGDTQSQMTSSDTQSQMTSSDAQSKMTSSDTQSKMTSSDTQSKMTSSDTLSEMTSSDTQSKMTSSDTLSEMTSSDTQSKMTSSDAQAEMTSSHIQPETTSLDTQREMTSSDIQRETTSSDTQPETTSSHIQEMTSSDTQPETTSSHIQPETTSSDAQPEMTYSDTQPETTSSDTQQPEEQQEHESHPMTHLPLGEEEEEEEQVKMAPSTPARRATRGRKRVTFPSPLLEPEMGASTGEEDSRVPATPSRVTRSGRHGNDSRVPLTPRPRTPRKAAPRPPPQETTDVPSATEEEEGTADAVTPKPTPSKQRAAQKAIPKKGTRKTRNSVVEEEVEVEEEKMEEEGVTLETAALVPVTRRKTRSATKTPDSKTAPTLPEKKKKKIEEEEEEEEEEEKPKELKRPPASRPGRTTRKSSQADVTLNLYPQEVDVVPTTPPRSRRKTSVEGTAEKRKSSNDISVVLPAGGSRRPTRGNLWSHQEEELLLLDTPLEVDSATPVADALIQRLREEEAREEEGAAAVVTETARVRKRGGKPSAPRAPSPQATGDPMVPEADEGSPVRDSFIYTPPRRRTRGRKAESLDGREAAVAPVTRTRRPAASTVTLEGQKVGDGDGRTEIMKPKTTRRMTTKPKVAPSTRFPVAVDLLSPLPSPAEPAPRAQTRVGDNDAPVPRMNLRRKRVMESIFPKPVTRRKKL